MQQFALLPHGQALEWKPRLTPLSAHPSSPPSDHARLHLSSSMLASHGPQTPGEAFGLNKKFFFFFFGFLARLAVVGV